jgi:hypothetical protein
MADFVIDGPYDIPYTWKPGGRTMDYAEFWNQSDEVKDLQWERGCYSDSTQTSLVLFACTTESVLSDTESCAGCVDRSTDKRRLSSSITIDAGGCAGIIPTSGLRSSTASCDTLLPIRQAVQQTSKLVGYYRFDHRSAGLRRQRGAYVGFDQNRIPGIDCAVRIYVRTEIRSIDGLT